jgi:hypothetical protein
MDLNPEVSVGQNIGSNCLSVGDLLPIKLFFEAEKNLQAALNSPETAPEGLETGWRPRIGKSTRASLARKITSHY